MHTIDFKASQKGMKKLLEIEGLITMIYKEQCVTTSDLELRDKVILNIKNAFKNCSDREYPQVLTGEIMISPFGSCQNGLWNVDQSDIDVTLVLEDKLTFNQHHLLKIVRKNYQTCCQIGDTNVCPSNQDPYSEIYREGDRLRGRLQY